MQTTIQYINKELQGLYPESEISGFSRLIFEHVLGWDYTQQVLNRNLKIEKKDFKQIAEIVYRIKTFEPIQYILGETVFADLRLKLMPGVLIPRPETEELVQWIVQENKSDTATILDIGTGSACIALALKNQIRQANVTALDVSAQALKIAHKNALLNNLEIHFVQVDILEWENYKWESFDTIVSNPPYVRELEKAQMNKNVLQFEPALALFVSNNDPLIFYRRIARFALKNLKVGGTLYFEINEFMAEEMKEMLSKLRLENIEIRKDIFGKDRMLRCSK